jgi:uncharacterized protein
MRAKPMAISSDGLQLEGELVSADAPRAVVIILHGLSAGHAKDPADTGYPGLARDISTAFGVSTAWVNLRGVRTSPGDFAIDGWVRDTIATVDAVRAAAPGLPVVLLGSSAGGYVALRAAAEHPGVDAVATWASVATWEDLISDGPGAIAYLRNAGLIKDPAFPPSTEAWIDAFRISAIEAVGKIAPRPLLLVHGDADTEVPPHHSETLFETAGEPKELARIPGGGHQLRRDQRAIDAFGDWLARSGWVTSAG